MSYTRTCGGCNQPFETYKSDATICYNCALGQITGGHAPEEGDFNTAALTSGKWSPREWSEFQDEMNSIDHTREEEFERQFQEDYMDPWDDLEEDPHDE